MPDQQDMQDYVRARMAGTQGPPQPAVNPMQQYVVAQGALGSRVPPDTMMDSPQFLQNPDVVGQPAAPPQSDRDLADEQLFARKDQLFKQIDEISKKLDSLPAGSPDRKKLFDQWHALGDQVDQLSDQFDAGSTGQWGKRQVEILDNQGADADAIQNAIQNRQAQPRQPLPPPAPGGVPYAPAPVTPQLPATAGLTS
jgi:hypothetical protein